MKSKLTLFLSSLIVLNLLIVNSVSAQTAITSATTTYSSASHDTTYHSKGAPESSLSGNDYTYNFGTLAGSTNNEQSLINFIAGGTLYTFLEIPNQYVKMRRVNNAVVSGTRNLIYSEGSVTGSTVNMNDSYSGNMETIFLGNKHFNSGTDNLFGNQGDGNGNNNDIERVDVIFPTGISATNYGNAGFTIFERGANGAHDPVKVAAILGLDVNGMPNSYSQIITITSATYGSADIISDRNYIIMRRDTANEPFKMSTITSQAIGGVLLKYSDFGVANNTVIYGYSIIPNDFSGTSANVVDYTNSTYFPTNSSSATGAGGIDLVAVTGVVESAPVISFPISGNVFDDANGLEDGIVNGTGTNAGGTLYAQLINSSNVVVSTVAVNSDGTYSFPAETPGTYSVVLSTSAGANTTASLPSGYVNTGENYGSGAGSDGNADGILRITVNESSVTNVDFGIDRLPNSDDKAAVYSVNGVNYPVPGLTGSDAEDGSCANGKEYTIITLPINGKLIYNGTGVTAGQVISNFNASLLTIDRLNSTMGTSFTYATIDAAVKQDPTPATVTINWVGVLPVVLSAFTVQNDNDNAALYWVTSSETNVKVFVIERSTDGKNWQAVGEVIAKSGGVKQSYTFTDDNAANGSNQYRLQVEDDNGSYTYSSIQQVWIQQDAASMKVYPNPVGQDEALNIELNGLKAGNYQISFNAVSGQIMKQMNFPINSSGAITLVIPTSKFPRGSYVLVVKGNNKQYTRNVVVADR